MTKSVLVIKVGMKNYIISSEATNIVFLNVHSISKQRMRGKKRERKKRREKNKMALI